MSADWQGRTGGNYPESKKQIYKDMANRERSTHMAKYPSYSYKYNSALSHLREPGSALNQPNNSTELKFGAAVLTDRTPTPFGYDYSPIATWYLGETRQRYALALEERKIWSERM